MSKTILIVDPDTQARRAIAEKLNAQQIESLEAESGHDAFELTVARQPDLVLTELFLSDITGLNLCRRLHENPKTARLPVIVMSTYADEIDRIISFELGVDDFVAKPFSAGELAARIRAILRRPRNEQGLTPVDDDRSSPRRILDESIGAGLSDATPRELEILSELIRAEGRVVTRDELIERIWSPHATATPRTVDAHIKSLRRKLGEARDRIRTIRGVGYRYDAATES